MNHSDVLSSRVLRLFLPHAENIDRETPIIPLRRSEDDNTAYLPTPSDILRATAEIRATWPPEVERSRRGWDHQSSAYRKHTGIRVVRTCEIDWSNR